MKHHCYSSIFRSFWTAVVVAAAGAATGGVASAQVPVLYYDFEDNALRTSFQNLVEQAINPGSGPIAREGGGPAIVGVAGAGIFNGGAASGQSLSTTGGVWPTSGVDPGTGAVNYYQFTVNSSGLAGLSLTVDGQRSGTGPPNVGVLYSTGGPYTSSGLNQSPGNGAFLAMSYDLSAITALDNQATVTFRIYGYGGSSTAGTFRIDNLTVLAKSITGSKTLLDHAALGLSVRSGTALNRTYSSLTVSGLGTIATISSSDVFLGGSGGTVLADVDATIATGKVLNVVTGGTASIKGSLQINPGGYPAGPGTYVYDSLSRLIFNHSGGYGVNNDNYWPTVSGPPNVRVNSGTGGITMNTSRTVSGTFDTADGVSLSGANTLTVDGNCQLNAGGYFNNSPTYGSSSTLTYATGGTYGIFNEWVGGTSQPGVPNHVLILNSTAVDFNPNRSGTAMTARGNVSIDGGSSLILGNSIGGDLDVGGNWTRAGTFTPNTRAVRFNGTSVQSVTGATTFDYLTLDNAAGLSLNNHITVNNTLTLTNGRITTGANLVTIAPGGNVAGASSARYVNGNLKKRCTVSSGNCSQSWEVGDNTEYAPVDFNTTNGLTQLDITAQTQPGDHPNLGTSGIDATKSVNRYWNLVLAPGQSFGASSVTLHHPASNVDGGANPANFVGRQYDSPTWAATGISGASSTQSTLTGVTHFSDFAVGELATIPTSTSLASDNNPSNFGEKVNLTATVTPAGATGTVEFFDGVTSLGTAPVDGFGVATLSISTLTVATHSITATYGGDGTYLTSTSNKIEQVVNLIPTFTALATTPAKGTCNDEVTFTATVSPAGATGTVSFFDGANPLGVAPLNLGGMAAITLTLPAGTYSLTAFYSGDATHAASTSPKVVFEVNFVATQTTLAVPPSSACGDKIVLHAEVAISGSGAPSLAGGSRPGLDASGNVEFYDGLTLLGAIPLDLDNVAELSISGLAVGLHSLTATYVGDGCHTASESPKVVHEVLIIPTTTALTVDRPKSNCGEKIILTATVTPANSPGTVEFFDNGNSIGVVPVDVNGQAMLSISGLAVGLHALTATYSGDPCHRGSTGGAPHEVSIIMTSMTLVVGPVKTSCGEKVTAFASVTPAGGTGVVQFFDGVNPLGGVPIAPNGQAVFSIPGLAIGMHSIRATYGGDECHTSSSDGPYSIEVNPLPAAVVLTAPASSVCDEKILLEANLSPVPGGGTVTFLDGATELANEPIDQFGYASISVFLGPPLGPRSLTARFNGFDCYGVSTSNKIVHEVTHGRSVTTITAPTKIFCGDKALLRAHVEPAGATGSVEFRDGMTVIGTVPLDASNNAELSVTNFTPGSHNVTAVHGGDACYTEREGGFVVIEVNALISTVTLASDPNPAKFGTKILLHANVTPPNIGGTVEYFDGLTSIGILNVNASGEATLSVSGLATGGHSLTARFSGAGCYGPSTSNTVTQMIVPDNPPVVTVMQPIQNQVVLLGNPVKFAWEATDDNQVVSIDIHLSRDKGVTYETIGLNLPNTGTYTWVSTPPATNLGPNPVFTAIILVTAHDNAAQTGADESDNFAIYDLATETLLSLFQSNPVSGGIELRWQFGRPDLMAEAALERATVSTGPWARVAAALRSESGATVVTDRDVEAGKTYFYRLVTGVRGGESMTFGPITETAGVAVSQFELTASPNPSFGPTRVDFAIPRETSVRVSIMDVQGRELVVLADGVFRAGRYQATWSGRTDRGEAPNGIYFVRYQTGAKQLVRRLVLAR